MAKKTPPAFAGGGSFAETTLEPTTRPSAMLQLVHRKYIELARPGIPPQFSARLGTDGMSSYFLLGSDDEQQAAKRARTIQRMIEREGWKAACDRHAREFTLALFWSNNPLLGTYTTLLTEPGASVAQPPAAGPSGNRPIRLAIVERDEPIRQALARWVGTLPGWRLAGSFSRLEDALLTRLLAAKEVDLILFNRTLSGSHSDTPRPDKAQSEIHNIPAFGFGIYETSDDIFTFHNSVSRGYFLHRTPPPAMLNPIRAAWDDAHTAPRDFHPQISSYFKELLARKTTGEATEERNSLTPREEEILLRLSKGYPDKQIAASLNISSWTVHNHMKNVFRKLGVHTRTQAVIKYLQK